MRATFQSKSLLRLTRTETFLPGVCVLVRLNENEMFKVKIGFNDIHQTGVSSLFASETYKFKLYWIRLAKAVNGTDSVLEQKISAHKLLVEERVKLKDLVLVENLQRGKYLVELEVIRGVGNNLCPDECVASESLENNKYRCVKCRKLFTYFDLNTVRRVVDPCASFKVQHEILDGWPDLAEDKILCATEILLKNQHDLVPNIVSMNVTRDIDLESLYLPFANYYEYDEILDESYMCMKSIIIISIYWIAVCVLCLFGCGCIFYLYSGTYSTKCFLIFHV